MISGTPTRSLLIANGENIGAMGHSCAKMTMDMYAHLMPRGGDEVANRLGRLVFEDTSAGGSVLVEHEAQVIDFAST